MDPGGLRVAPRQRRWSTHETCWPRRPPARPGGHRRGLPQPRPVAARAGLLASPRRAALRRSVRHGRAPPPHDAPGRRPQRRCRLPPGSRWVGLAIYQQKTVALVQWPHKIGGLLANEKPWDMPLHQVRKAAKEPHGDIMATTSDDDPGAPGFRHRISRQFCSSAENIEALASFVATEADVPVRHFLGQYERRRQELHRTSLRSRSSSG